MYGHVVRFKHFLYILDILDNLPPARLLVYICTCNVSRLPPSCFPFLKKSASPVTKQQRTEATTIMRTLEFSFKIEGLLAVIIVGAAGKIVQNMQNLLEFDRKN